MANGQLEVVNDDDDASRPYGCTGICSGFFNGCILHCKLTLALVQNLDGR
jgi:hypothetical protein